MTRSDSFVLSQTVLLCSPAYDSCWLPKVFRVSRYEAIMSLMRSPEQTALVVCEMCRGDCDSTPLPARKGASAAGCLSEAASRSVWPIDGLGRWCKGLGG